MSNEIQQVPDYLRQGAVGEANAKAAGDAASMASSSMSVPRVSLRGREFRFVEGGEEVRKHRDFVDFVIMGVEPEAGRMIKTYYKDGYKPGAKEPPTCASDDGIAPGMWVVNKQSPTCASCKLNAFGSAQSPNGKPTKACRDSKRIWIALNMEQDKATPIGQRTLYGLNVTVASLKSFSELGRSLASLGVAPAVAVTRATMLDTEFPQLEFSLSGWVSAEDAPKCLELSEKRPWKMVSGAALALAMNEGSSAPSIALPGGVAAAPPKPDAEKVVPSAGSLDSDLNKW